MTYSNIKQISKHILSRHNVPVVYSIPKKDRIN